MGSEISSTVDDFAQEFETAIDNITEELKTSIDAVVNVIDDLTEKLETIFDEVVNDISNLIKHGRELLSCLSSIIRLVALICDFLLLGTQALFEATANLIKIQARRVGNYIKVKLTNLRNSFTWSGDIDPHNQASAASQIQQGISRVQS